MRLEKRRTVARKEERTARRQLYESGTTRHIEPLCSVAKQPTKRNRLILFNALIVRRVNRRTVAAMRGKDTARHQ